MAVTTIRKWKDATHGFELYAGDKLVGYAMTSEYGTICFCGPLGRGTAESIEGAKQTVDDMFNPESPYSQMIKAATEAMKASNQ